MLKLKSIIAKAIGFIRKIVASAALAEKCEAAFRPVVRSVRAALNPRLLAGMVSAILLVGCATDKHWDALMILAPKDGGEAVHAVVQVPSKMAKGSSDIALNVEGDVYKGKMICAKEGFTSQSSSGAVGSGGGWAFGGGSSSTVANLSACRATLISGEKSMLCEVAGTWEDVTSEARENANAVLAVLAFPTAFLSAALIDHDLAPIGTGECRKNDGTIYVVQIVEPPQEE